MLKQNLTDYPLIARTKDAASIKSGLQMFFRSFVASIMEKNILYDNPVLLENIEVWITTLSSAASRPLRHTATVASLEIIRALTESGNKIAIQTAHYLRQCGTESRKAGNNKGRIASIERSAKIASQKQEVIDNLIKDWVEAVFIHRYRDVDPKIRFDCVEALGDWVMLYPDHFLDGIHLRYLGWMLSDPSPLIRMKVVKKLHSIFDDVNKVMGLKTFTERFRKRMVEMATRDADISVRSSTIHLLLTLRKAGLLEPNDIDSVGRLVYCTEQRVRNVAAAFFAENVKDLYDSVVDDLGGKEAIDNVLSSADDEDYESPKVEWITYKCLAQVLGGYDLDDENMPPPSIKKAADHPIAAPTSQNSVSHYSLAARELYRHIPELKHGDILAAYLLFDHSEATQSSASEDVEARIKYECKLNETEEMILIEILVVSIEERLNESFDHPSLGKARKTKAQSEKMSEQRQSLIRHFATLFPRLLKKFDSSPEAVSIILRLEHVLNLEVIEKMCHNSSAFSTFLDDIKRQFTSHSNEAVIIEACASLLHAKNLGENDELIDNSINSLWEDMLNNLSLLRKSKDPSIRGNLSPTSLVQLSNTVLRIENLAKISDCTEALENEIPHNSSDTRSCIDVLISLLCRGIPTKSLTSETNFLEDKITVRVSRSVVYYFMWRIATLKGENREDKKIAKTALDSLASRKASAINNFTQVINSRRRADQVRLSVAGSILDITTLFATLRHLLKPKDSNDRTSNPNSAYYTALAKPIDAATQRNLIRVLDAAMTDFAGKSGRVLDRSKGRVVNGLLQDDDDEEQDFDEDPISDSDTDDEDNAHNEANGATKILAAEQALCDIAGKMVLAIFAGVLDDAENSKKDKNGWGPARRQMENFKTRLGNNFREVVTFLAPDKIRNGKKTSMKDKGRNEDLPPSAKSKETIALSDEEHERDSESVQNGANDDIEGNIDEERESNEQAAEVSDDDATGGVDQRDANDSEAESPLGD